MASIKDLKRMCKSYKNCHECPLNDTCCGDSVSALPDNADEIVDEWVSEHPVKTYMQDFFEKFPNAGRNEKNIPMTRGGIICRKSLYVDTLPCIYGNEGCGKCWNQEVEK